MATYFDILPIELIASIAYQFPYTQELFRLGKIIKYDDKFWLNLVKLAFPFAYKKDYKWKTLYLNILLSRHGNINKLFEDNNLVELLKFYIHEGILNAQDYDKYLDNVVRNNDVDTVDKMLSYYKVHPEFSAKVDWNRVLESSLHVEMLSLSYVIIKKYMNDKQSVMSVLKRYLSTASYRESNVSMDFIFAYLNFGHDDKVKLIKALATNESYQIVTYLEKYDIRFTYSYEIVKFLYGVPNTAKLSVIKYILSDYNSYFEAIEGFESLYDSVITNVSIVSDVKMFRRMLGILSDFPTYKLLRQRDEIDT